MHHDEYRRRNQVGSTSLGMLLLGLTLAVGLIVSAFVVSRSLERIKLAGDKIMVKGYAEEKVVSDAGTWRGTVTVRATDLQAGYRELEKDTARVKQMLEAAAGNRLQRYRSLRSRPEPSTRPARAAYRPDA